MSAYLYDTGASTFDPALLERVLAEKYPINDGLQNRILDSSVPLLFNVGFELQRGYDLSYLELWENMGFRTMVGIALRNGNTNIGLLWLSIDEINIPILQGICSQIAIAMGNIMANEEGRNISSAELNAGVKHHVILSIVGAHLMEGMGYMRAKRIQADLVEKSGIPYTIVRSTQFQEFVPTIAAGGTQGNEVHVSQIDFQPIAAEEVALFITRFAISEPANAIVEIAGPVRAPMNEFVEKYVRATDAGKSVVALGSNEYFGLAVPPSTLVPQGNAYLGETRFEDYLHSHSTQA